MFLSSQAINQKSAYQVLQKNSNTFLFITDNSVTLEVGFVEDYTLEIEGVYQFFILNDSSDISHTPKDPNIKQTILQSLRSSLNRIRQLFCMSVTYLTVDRTYVTGYFEFGLRNTMINIVIA